ncbi:ClpX C4-type zinc finger protein [Mesorhizobium sp. ArgA1]
MHDESITETWVKLSREGDYAAILRTACEYYETLTQAGSTEEATACLGVISVTVQHLLSTSSDDSAIEGAAEASTVSCSFCGRTQADARIGAGPSAFICEFCVTDFSDIFAEGVRD